MSSKLSTTADMDDKNVEKSHESYLAAIVTAFLMGNLNESDTLNRPKLNDNIKSVYWIFIIQYALLAIIGIVTNIAIIYYVMSNKLFKDITHAFLVNLSLCHVVQCAVVLPITLMVMIIQNWIWGQFLCFFLPMLQDIPLHVAMISHILIAWDRMRWLGDPLKGRLPTFVCCCASWLTGMVIALPYPIYTLYLDLGDYVPYLKGVGLCIVNLLDDMHEYMRGLFVIMYCGPVILLAYLYIRTSAELRPPDGPFAVMMFEHRAELRNRQRNSTSSGHPTTSRQNSNHSYDLYNAELDLSMEKRTQRNLGSMAVTQVLCICPLMVLRLAKMVMIETYENSKHFDFTYLMFVWIAFLPTVIFPCIYALQILPGNDKERLRGYFRLSSRRSKKSQQNLNDNSNQQENATTTTEPGSGVIVNSSSSGVKVSSQLRPSNELKSKILNPLSRKYDDVIIGPPRPIIPKVTANLSVSNTLSTNLATTPQSASAGLLQPRKSFANSNSVNTSCSNITSSTYCNNGSNCVLNGSGNINCGCNINDSMRTIDAKKGNEKLIDGNIECDVMSILSDSTAKDSYFDKKWHIANTSSMKTRDLLRHTKDNMSSFSDCDGGTSSSSFTRNDSSSTFDRDLEIIDLLERERSMDIQDMMEREMHGENVRKYNIMERRRLPDLEKICKSPKILDSTQHQPNFNNVEVDRNYYATSSSYVPSQQKQLHPSKRQGQTNPFNHRLPKRDSVKSLRNNSSAVSAAAATAKSANTDESPIIIAGFSENDVAAIGGVGLITGTSTTISNSGLCVDDSVRTNLRKSTTTFGRSSIKSNASGCTNSNRDYILSTNPHPNLDFRENIFEEL